MMSEITKVQRFWFHYIEILQLWLIIPTINVSVIGSDCIIQKDKNSVTQFIDNLEKKGLVQRVVDSSDRRVNNIRLSKAGKAMKDNTKQVAIAALNDIVAGIPEEDLKSFVRVLNKACDNIEKLKL